MKETLEGVEEIFDKRGATDATQTFERLWSITEELMVDLMYDLPEEAAGAKYVITDDIVDGDAPISAARQLKKKESA